MQSESTEYFGAFATTMASQRLSIQSVAPFATVWPEYKGEFRDPQLWGMLRAGIYTNRNPQRLPNIPLNRLPSFAIYLPMCWTIFVARRNGSF